jgi:hypothetical protein
MALEIWTLEDGQPPEVMEASCSQSGIYTPDPSLLLFPSVLSLTSPARTPTGMNLGEEMHPSQGLCEPRTLSRDFTKKSSPKKTFLASFCKTTSMYLPLSYLEITIRLRVRALASHVQSPNFHPQHRKKKCNKACPGVSPEQTSDVHLGNAPKRVSEKEKSRTSASPQTE